MKHTKRKTPTVKPSEIVFHGHTFPSGLAVFSCYSRDLGQFRTDEPDEKEAKAEALAYFNREARK